MLEQSLGLQRDRVLPTTAPVSVSSVRGEQPTNLRSPGFVRRSRELAAGCDDARRARRPPDVGFRVRSVLQVLQGITRRDTVAYVFIKDTEA